MGSLDCCQKGVRNELVIETDQGNIQDKEGFPQDTDPAIRSKKIEEENPNENIAVNQGEEQPNQENNNYEIEIGESNPKEIEQNEPNENYENNEANTNMNFPNTDNNIVQGTNDVDIKYDLPSYENNVIGNVENAGNQGIDTNNVAQGELNIDQLLQNYNEQQQVQGNQNAPVEEDYNKYFEQNPTQQNTNDIDINQYFNDNNQNNQNNANLEPMYTFGENQTDTNNIVSSNINQTSQEYNYDYNYNIPNA